MSGLSELHARAAHVCVRARYLVLICEHVLACEKIGNLRAADINKCLQRIAASLKKEMPISGWKNYLIISAVWAVQGHQSNNSRTLMNGCLSAFFTVQRFSEFKTVRGTSITDQVYAINANHPNLQGFFHFFQHIKPLQILLRRDKMWNSTPSLDFDQTIQRIGTPSMEMPCYWHNMTWVGPKLPVPSAAQGVVNLQNLPCRFCSWSWE